MFKWGAENELVPGRVFYDMQTVSGLRKGRTKANESEPVLPVTDAEWFSVVLKLLAMHWIRSSLLRGGRFVQHTTQFRDLLL